MAPTEFTLELDTSELRRQLDELHAFAAQRWPGGDGAPEWFNESIAPMLAKSVEVGPSMPDGRGGYVIACKYGHFYDQVMQALQGDNPEKSPVPGGDA